MITAGNSFNHLVQHDKKEDHKLITNGVYSIFRHPSYTGFYYWSVGMQLMLGNPICFFLYAYASYKFFSIRIPEEEETLIAFFGDEYRTYRKNTFVLIPGLH
jgi:protein-S-isoprenylcysteine O-methyltransferase